MNVLSLFDGISIGQLALHKVGLTVDNYYASEINKFSMNVTQHHFPKTIQLGDVCDWKNWNIDWKSIDLLIGGSPCFVKGSKVYTRSGYKSIENIVVGEEVLTHTNTWKKVLNVGSTLNKEIWEVHTLNGFKFETTSNHPFYTVQMEEAHYTDCIFKTVEQITNKDYLVNLIDMDGSGVKNYNFDKVTCVVKTDRKETVYNIEVEDDHTYIVNDKIVHNCQNISLGGDKKGLDGEKSKLFFVYRDILNYLKEINPNILFLLENVKGKKEVLDKISEEIGVEPNRINSNLVSAQNRDRFYWTNINGSVIPQPEDKGILLKDILISAEDGKYPLSKKHLDGFLRNYPNWKPSFRDEKSKPILASYYKQPPHCPYIPDENSESGYRRLSAVECERCQTLPDNYTNIDGASYKSRVEAIGNGWTLDVISHIFSYIK